MRKAITPDSYESSPSHFGRRINRRTNSPEMEIAARTAKTAPVEIEIARGQKSRPESNRNVIQRDQREGAEPPEHEGVGQTRQRPLADDFGLEHHFPDQLANPWAHGKQRNIPVPLGCAYSAENCAEAPPESHDGDRTARRAAISQTSSPKNVACAVKRLRMLENASSCFRSRGVHRLPFMRPPAGGWRRRGRPGQSDYGFPTEYRAPGGSSRSSPSGKSMSRDP